MAPLAPVTQLASQSTQPTFGYKAGQLATSFTG
jgi:hypothetical protein